MVCSDYREFISRSYALVVSSTYRNINLIYNALAIK